MLETGVISEVLSDSDGIRTHYQLNLKRTHNHLAKLARLAKCLSVCLRPKVVVGSNDVAVT